MPTVSNIDHDAIHPTSPAPKQKSLWHNSNFLLLCSGQGISAIGSQMTQVSFPLLLLALTHSPAQAGLLTALGTLPVALFSLPAGALIDRWERKRVMMLCDAGRFLALGSIPIALAFGHLTFLQIALAAFIEGMLALLFTLAEAAATPHVVEKEQLASALGINGVLDSASSTLGPTLAPILYGLGQAVPFAIDAISYGISCGSLILIKTKFQGERNNSPRHLRRDIGEGLRWLWGHTFLRFLAILTFGLYAPCAGFMLILITQAQRLHATNTQLGLILACGGFGSIIGSLLAGPLSKRLRFSAMMMWTIWIWALSWLFYAFAPNPLILGIGNCLTFIVVPLYSVAQYSRRLALIPDHLQGRVNAVYRLIAFGSQPIGLALTGLLLQLVGPVDTVFIMFIPQAALAIIVTCKQKFLRMADNL